MYIDLLRNFRFDKEEPGGGTAVEAPEIESAPKLEPNKEEGSTVPYDRFKEVVEEKNKYKTKLDEKDQEKVENERKELENQGKYQEAAELAENRAKLAEEKATKAEKEKKDKSIEYEIGLEAKNQGINDVKDAAKLIDLTKIIVNDDGTITGVKEVIAELKKDKSYLFNDKKIGVHTDHAKGAEDMTKEELLSDPVAMTKLRRENKSEYDRILGK